MGVLREGIWTTRVVRSSTATPLPAGGIRGHVLFARLNVRGKISPAVVHSVPSFPPYALRNF